MTETFHKLIFSVPNREADRLSDKLSELGAISVSLEAHDDTEIFEPALNTTPLWQQVNVTALFAEADAPNLIIAELKREARWQDIDVAISSLQDQDWQANLKQDFQPIQIAENLWICPSWAAAPDPHAINIILDPGLAFGTGKHATTALCLAWLARTVQTGDTVIDYGCGSGILAIAALKLGAKHVYAIDHDVQALQASTSNAEINQVDKTDLTLTQHPSDLAAQVDILVANILAKPLISLAPHFASLVKTGGKLALSGILEKQMQEVSQAYQAWFDIGELSLSEDWGLITAIRNPISVPQHS